MKRRVRDGVGDGRGQGFRLLTEPASLKLSTEELRPVLTAGFRLLTEPASLKLDGLTEVAEGALGFRLLTEPASLKRTDRDGAGLARPH